MQERTTDHTDPRHMIFSSFASLPFSQRQIFPSAPCPPSSLRVQIPSFTPTHPNNPLHYNTVYWLYSDFSNSSDNYDVGKEILRLNGTNIVRRHLGFSSSTSVYAKSSFTAQSASQVLNCDHKNEGSMCLRNIGIHSRPHGVHNPEYHSVNIPYTLRSRDRASWAKREERIPTRCNNINDLLSVPDVDYCLLSRHVSGIFMPIIRRKDHVLLHMGFSW